MPDEAEPWIAPAIGSAAHKVAGLANVPDEARNEFCTRLGLVLVDTAKLTVLRAHPLRISSKSIALHLLKVQGAAEMLCRAIEDLEDEAHDRRRDHNRRLARVYLENELRDVELANAPYRRDVKRRAMWTPDRRPILTPSIG
jgi:hypothetical protein